MIFNATGMQGQTLARGFQLEGHQITVPVRSKEKGEQMTAQGYKAFETDFSQDSLLPQMKQVDHVIAQIPAMVSPDTMVQFAEKLINAIKATENVRAVLVISSIVPDKKVGIKSVDARVEIRDYVLEQLPDTPILSATEYLENFSTAYRHPILNEGVIPQTIPASVPVNYLSWEDLATYVTAAAKDHKLAGGFYRIAGNEGISGDQLATRLGKVLDKPLKYVEIDHAQLQGMLTPILGAEVAKDYAEFYRYQDNEGRHLLNPDTNKLQEQLGVETLKLEDWAKRAFAVA